MRRLEWLRRNGMASWSLEATWFMLYNISIDMSVALVRLEGLRSQILVGWSNGERKQL